ncbi:MAG: OsmC family protein [Polaromonas sp.]
MTEKLKMTFTVSARRADAHGSEAHCKDARITLDTDLAGRRDAFNPAELLLAALSACMIKGIERVTPILKFDLRSVDVRVHGVRQDVPPRMESIRYEIVVDTDESEQRLNLLHENVKKYGTVFNTVAPGTNLSGVLRRKSANDTAEAP